MARRKATNQMTLLRRADIPTRTLQEEVEGAFLEYAMSVIVQRALPDVRDGLKPVQRRILWAMHDANLRPDRPFVKCARVVGEVMANYHPHGDTSIYEALVRMGQTFSLTAPLIDKHGNFGSPSDPPAASRYTECRLTPACDGIARGHRRRHRRLRRRTTTVRAPSRSCSRRASRTCSSTARRASRSAWPPTSRPTTSPRSATRRSS